MHVAGAYALVLILANFRLSGECPPTVVHGFFMVRSYELLTLNIFLAGGTYYIYQKLFGVKRAILHNAIFALFVLIVSEGLRIFGLATCLDSGNMHVIILAMFHHFMSIRLKKMYLMGAMVPIWMVPSFIYLLTLCALWRKEHFIIAAFCAGFQKIFRRASKRYYENKTLLPKYGSGCASKQCQQQCASRAQPQPAPIQQHQNVQNNFDFDANKLNIKMDDVSQYRLKQLLQMGYPLEQAVLALNATGLDDRGKPISSQESVQKAVELIADGQVNPTDNVQVIQTDAQPTHAL